MSNYTRRDFIRRSAAGAAGLGLMLNGKWVPLEATPLPPPAAPTTASTWVSSDSAFAGTS